MAVSLVFWSLVISPSLVSFSLPSHFSQLVNALNFQKPTGVDGNPMFCYHGMMHITRKQTLRSFGMTPTFQNLTLLTKVGVMPKEGWARPCAPIHDNDKDLKVYLM